MRPEFLTPQAADRGSRRTSGETSARAGLYLLIADVTVLSHSGHPTRGCIPRGQRVRSPPATSAGTLHGALICPSKEQLGTHQTFKARFWPCLEPFSRESSEQPCELFSPRSSAEGSSSADRGSQTRCSSHILSTFLRFCQPLENLQTQEAVPRRARV